MTSSLWGTFIIFHVPARVAIVLTRHSPPSLPQPQRGTNLVPNPDVEILRILEGSRALQAFYPWPQVFWILTSWPVQVLVLQWRTIYPIRRRIPLTLPIWQTLFLRRNYQFYHTILDNNFPLRPLVEPFMGMFLWMIDFVRKKNFHRAMFMIWRFSATCTCRKKKDILLLLPR